MLKKQSLIGNARWRIRLREFRIYIIAALLGAAASGAALLLFSIIVYLLKIPISISGFFSVAAFGAGCLTAGFTAGAMKRKNGLRSGVIAALLFAVPIALGGFILSAVGTGAISKIIAAILCGAIGGVIGVNRNGGF